jgi:hypothetical protein
MLDMPGRKAAKSGTLERLQRISAGGAAARRLGTLGSPKISPLPQMEWSK